MREYSTVGLVLERQPLREADLRFTFFTRDFGKLVARARSGRSITSKLAPHLEPLNFVQLRLVEKNGFQVADALRFGQHAFHHLPILSLVSALAPEGEPDPELWALLERKDTTVREVLISLGFDPEFATCVSCGAANPTRFSTVDLSYRCEACARKSRGAGGLYQVRSISS